MEENWSSLIKPTHRYIQTLQTVWHWTQVLLAVKPKCCLAATYQFPPVILRGKSGGFIIPNITLCERKKLIVWRKVILTKHANSIKEPNENRDVPYCSNWAFGMGRSTTAKMAHIPPLLTNSRLLTLSQLNWGNYSPFFHQCMCKGSFLQQTNVPVGMQSQLKARNEQ